MCEHAHVWSLSVQRGMCMPRSESDIHCLPQSLSALTFEARSQAEPGAERPGMIGQEPPGILQSPPLQVWDYREALQAPVYKAATDSKVLALRKPSLQPPTSGCKPGPFKLFPLNFRYFGRGGL